MSSKLKMQLPGYKDSIADKENHDSSNIVKKNASISSKIEPKEFPVDKIRVFLGDTDSPSAEEKQFQKNTENLEEVILKQNFLEKNQLFNPTAYFGGLVITDLGNYSPDRRLEEMFEEYLPTEEDQPPEDDRPANQNPNKANQTSNSQNKTQIKANLNSNTKNFFNKKNNTTSSKTTSNNNKDSNAQKSTEPKNIKKFGPQIPVQSSADKLKFLFKENMNEKSSIAKKSNSFLNSKGSINISNIENIGVESSRFLDSQAANKLGQKPPKTKILEMKNYQAKPGNENFPNKVASEKVISDKTIASKLLGSSLSPRSIPFSQPLLKAKAREETYSAERKIEKERCLRSKDKNFFSFTQNTLPDEDVESNYNAFSRDYSRPKTANPSFIEDATPLIKSIISPKFCKTPQIETNKSLISSSKHDEKKISTSNPLKFFNDFLNKSKINSVASSNHIKMPKKYTFIESKHQDSTNSNEGNKSKLEKEKTVNKSTLQSSGGNFQNFTNITSAKRLFGNKANK